MSSHVKCYIGGNVLWRTIVLEDMSNRKTCLTGVHSTGHVLQDMSYRTYLTGHALREKMPYGSNMSLMGGHFL